jgi:hypothetical protein
MSIFSDIKAKCDREVVEVAISKARSKVFAGMSVDEVYELLNEVLEYCNRNIQE